MPEAGKEISVRYRRQLRDSLTAHFSMGELRSLCFDLDIEFEDLEGSSKTNKAESLLSTMERLDRIPELVQVCGQQRPNVVWTFQARLFICYKRYSEHDNRLAGHLFEYLSALDHQVFIDKTMRAGTKWLDKIDQEIQAADFLIVLLSKESADSEMVQKEVSRAYEHRKLQGHPKILPVRVNFSGLLPYSIDAFVNSSQYVVWQSEADDDRVGEEIVQAIEGDLPDRKPHQVESRTEILVSEDGRYLPGEDAAQAPLPKFDPRILDDLVAPGGTIRLRDEFYVKRDDDEQLKRQVLREGAITTIRASRQTGKSSLLVRGLHAARQAGAKVIMLDLQRVDSDFLQDPDKFLLYLANFIFRRLRLDPQEVERGWKGPLGPQDKLTYLMEDSVLATVDEPIVLGIDEADRLLDTPFYSDFFSLIRSWHNSAAFDDLWARLNICMVISTEPYLLIADANQSPFNVGLKIYLDDFDEQQVEGLNRRHGSPVSAADFPEFMELLGGHPYLTRKALYTMVTEKMSWPEFAAVAASDKGPFSDHLRRQMWLLHDQSDLQAELRQVVRNHRCQNEEARFRLLRAGLIRASGDVCRGRCGLYEQYFGDRLG